LTKDKADALQAAMVGGDARSVSAGAEVVISAAGSGEPAAEQARACQGAGGRTSEESAAGDHSPGARPGCESRRLRRQLAVLQACVAGIKNR
jgi:hypothetical protein